MPKVNVYSDEAVRLFLDSLPRHTTYSEMAAACLERFGVERAWCRSKIGRYWGAFHPPGKGKASRIDFDPEVREFVEDRLGRLTIRMILDGCREQFGMERAPSKSSLHRSIGIGNGPESGSHPTKYRAMAVHPSLITATTE